MDKKQDNLILEIENLTIHYETEDEVVKAVRGISLKLERRKAIGLVGETGAGKTTTALAILRLVPSPPGVIKSGSIKVEGKDIFALNYEQLQKMRGNDVSMVFQDPMTSLNPVFTVGRQIAETIRIHEKI